MYISSQNVSEFWNVLTRPAGSNGFGLSPAQADLDVTHLERELFRAVTRSHFSLLARRETCCCDVDPWNLALATFNAGDFKRFPSITAVDPKDI